LQFNFILAVWSRALSDFNVHQKTRVLRNTVSVHFIATQINVTHT